MLGRKNAQREKTNRPKQKLKIKQQWKTTEITG